MELKNRTILITGANKGIGFETARQVLQKGHFVYLGSRNLQKGIEAIKKLKAEGFSNVEVIQIDVTDDHSVKAARTEIGEKKGALDALINNAAIMGASFSETGEFLPQIATGIGSNTKVFMQVYETNVYGVVRVTQAFIDLLKKSPEPRIVMVSSPVGSLTLQSDPDWLGYDFAKFAVYGSSKSALNMYTVHLAYELRDTVFKVNAVDPGYTKTDINYLQGPGTVEDAAKRIVKYALIDQNGPNGKFFSEEINPETGEISW